MLDNLLNPGALRGDSGLQAIANPGALREASGLSLAQRGGGRRRREERDEELAIQAVQDLFNAVFTR